jgi:hypothetical protein
MTKFRHHIFAWSFAIALACSACLETAQAGTDPVPPGVAAANQYREILPTAAGGVAVRSNLGSSARPTPELRRAIARSGGADRAELTKVAVTARSAAPRAPARTGVTTIASSDKANGGTSRGDVAGPGLITLLLVLCALLGVTVMSVWRRPRVQQKRPQATRSAPDDA